MNETQPHIVHDKRSGHTANMHRLIIDGVAGKWARAFDEFAVHERGYAAAPWSCVVLPRVFKYNTEYATQVEPRRITEYYTDGELGLEGFK